MFNVLLEIAEQERQFGEHGKDRAGRMKNNFKLLATGASISATVKSISSSGFFLLVKEKEYFLSCNDYPCFRNQPSQAIQAVELLHGYHLHWPELDVDLEIDNLEHPEKYPLKWQNKEFLPAN